MSTSSSPQVVHILTTKFKSHFQFLYHNSFMLQVYSQFLSIMQLTIIYVGYHPCIHITVHLYIKDFYKPLLKS